MKVTVLGAGAMGSALTVPLSDKKNDVNLWGTEYDDEMIGSIRKDRTHPRLGVKVPESVKPFLHDQLDEALEGAEVVVIGVSSDAVGAITERIAPLLGSETPIVCVSKGLHLNDKGRVVTLPDLIGSRLDGSNQVVAVGGPSIAKEVAMRIPTWVVYASADESAARHVADAISTPSYVVSTSDDVLGVELCSALKNVYAIAVGIVEGARKSRGLDTMNNTKSLAVVQGVKEMAWIVKAAGGRRRTVHGPAGLGDLDVTCRGGRNGAYGELIGTGRSAADALSEMKGKGLTVEGYAATDLAWRLVRRMDEKRKLQTAQVPLLGALYSVLYEKKAGAALVDELTRRIGG